MSRRLWDQAESAQKLATAAERDEAVSIMDYLKQLKAAADAEIAVKKYELYKDIKTKSEQYANRLRTWRKKTESRMDRPVVIGGRKAGKKEAQRLRDSQKKQMELNSVIIDKEMAAVAMASQEMDRLNDAATAL